MEIAIKEAILANSESLFGTVVNEGLIQFQKTRKGEMNAQQHTDNVVKFLLKLRNNTM